MHADRALAFLRALAGYPAEAEAQTSAGFRSVRTDGVFDNWIDGNAAALRLLDSTSPEYKALFGRLYAAWFELNMAPGGLPPAVRPLYDAFDAYKREWEAGTADPKRLNEYVLEANTARRHVFEITGDARFARASDLQTIDTTRASASVKAAAQVDKAVEDGKKAAADASGSLWRAIPLRVKIGVPIVLGVAAWIAKKVTP